MEEVDALLGVALEEIRRKIIRHNRGKVQKAERGS